MLVVSRNNVETEYIKEFDPTQRFIKLPIDNYLRLLNLYDTINRPQIALIKQKFQELEEAGVGSSKDIADLLHLSHKMSMDLLDKQLQLEKLRLGTPGPQKQVNVQINDDGSKYSQLIHKLVSGTGI